METRRLPANHRALYLAQLVKSREEPTASRPQCLKTLSYQRPLLRRVGRRSRPTRAAAARPIQQLPTEQHQIALVGKLRIVDARLGSRRRAGIPALEHGCKTAFDQAWHGYARPLSNLPAGRWRFLRSVPRPISIKFWRMLSRRHGSKTSRGANA